jgi:hypothetical protein
VTYTKREGRHAHALQNLAFKDVFFDLQMCIPAVSSTLFIQPIRTFKTQPHRYCTNESCLANVCKIILDTAKAEIGLEKCSEAAQMQSQAVTERNFEQAAQQQ